MPKFEITKNSKLGIASLLFLSGIVKYEIGQDDDKSLTHKMWFAHGDGSVTVEKYSHKELYDFSQNITKTADLINSVLKDMEG